MHHTPTPLKDTNTFERPGSISPTWNNSGGNNDQKEKNIYIYQPTYKNWMACKRQFSPKLAVAFDVIFHKFWLTCR
jgi:hypothetical protein